MAKPTDEGNFADAVYGQMEPMQYAEADLDYPLLKFVGAIGQMFEPFDFIAHNWGILLNLDRIPDAGLPWLGQFIGVSVDTSQPVDRQKQQIRDHVGWGRGTLAALKASIKHMLTGTQTVIIVERTPDAYGLIVETIDVESPPDVTYQTIYDNYLTYQLFYNAWSTYGMFWASIPSVQIIRILNDAKPAGLLLGYRVISTAPLPITYEPLYDNYAEEETIYDDFQTYKDVYTKTL